MARYTGPKSKIARKFGEPIYGPDKALERRNYPSGQHGLARRRRKISEYGVQLKEKQKAKSISNLNAIPLAFNNHAEIFRSSGKTPYFKYKENVQLHEVHFDDPCSFEEKLNLVDKYNLLGGSIWTISTYTPYLYKLIDYYFKK